MTGWGHDPIAPARDMTGIGPPTPDRVPSPEAVNHGCTLMNTDTRKGSKEKPGAIGNRLSALPSCSLPHCLSHSLPHSPSSPPSEISSGLSSGLPSGFLSRLPSGLPSELLRNRPLWYRLRLRPGLRPNSLPGCRARTPAGTRARLLHDLDPTRHRGNRSPGLEMRPRTPESHVPCNVPSSTRG